MMQYVTDTSTRGICPVGWHIPTDFEWKVLEGTVDSQYDVGDPEWDSSGWRGFDAGLNLKSTFGWSSSGNGTDIYNFTALPAGNHASGGFCCLGLWGIFWTSVEYTSSTKIYRLFEYNKDQVYRSNIGDIYGYSVRCIKN